MKRIVVADSQNAIVLVSAVNHDHFFGVVPRGSSYKGFIVQENFRQGSYSILVTDGLTHHNEITIGEDTGNLAEFIKSLLNGGHSVFQFDSFKELSDWLNNGDN